MTAEGWELALACDIIIASTTAYFAFPEPKVGLVALAGGAIILPHLIGYHRAMEIILTGRNVSTQEALSLGLVSHVVEDVLVKATEIAQSIVACSPEAIAASKTVARLGYAAPDLIYNLAKQGDVPQVRKLANSANTKEGVAAFIVRRKPVWQIANL